MSFKVGEKVVCVNDTWSRNDGYVELSGTE